MYYNSSGVLCCCNAFRYKMEFLWQYKDTANVVIIEKYSRAHYGVNPIAFSDSVFAINMAVSATIIQRNSFLFKNYILPHVKNLKVLVLSLDIDREVTQAIVQIICFINRMPSYWYVYDMNHNFWKDEEPVGLFEATYNSLVQVVWLILLDLHGGYNTRR